MAVQTVPYALQNASHSAALFRQSASAAFVTGGALAGNELAVSQQGSPNMSVILGPGRAKVVGTSVSPQVGMGFTTQAMYDVLNDANITLTVAASNPTNPRIDVVYVQVQDSFYSGAANQAIAGIVTGTPGPSPAVPATPANAIAISTIAVGAGVTSIVSANISRVGYRAGVIGGPLNFLTIAQRDAWTTANSGGLVFGDLCVVGTSDFMWSGSAWTAVIPTATLLNTADIASGVTATAAPAPFQTAPTLRSVTWAVSPNPSRVTVGVAGLYLINARANIGSTTNGTAYLRVNGSTASPRVFVAANASGLALVSVLDQLTLAAGDYVELMVQSNGTFTLFAGTMLDITLIARR